MNSDLIAARVDGVKSLDPDGIPVAFSNSEETRPAAASDGAGTTLIVYEKHSEQGGSPIKIGFRMLTTR